MTTCSVKWCGNNSRNCSINKNNISFHRFPKNPDRKLEWIEACSRQENWFPTKVNVICSRHFSADCIYYVKNRRWISESAVPTLYLPVLKPGVTEQNIPILHDPGSEASASETYVFSEDTQPGPEDYEMVTVKEEFPPPEDDNMAVDTDNVKKEPADDTYSGPEIQVVYTHIPKALPDTEALTQQQTNALICKYKNKIKDLQDQNLVIQEKCNQLTNLVKKCLNVTPSRNIEMELKKILGKDTNQDSKEEILDKTLDTEEELLARIKMLENNFKHLQEQFADKQHHWSIRENELICKMTQMTDQLKTVVLIKKEDNAAAGLLEKDNYFTQKEKEWAEKERKLLEHFQLKETQWQQAILSHNALIEEYKNEIKDLQDKNLALQEQCEQLTELLEKCLNKTHDFNEVGVQLKEILARNKAHHSRNGSKQSL